MMKRTNRDETNQITVPAKPFRPSARHTREVNDALAKAYPDSRCALDFADLYQLIVATILSAQCTDKRVNIVTPRLFDIWPNAASLAAADPEELESVIRSTGFYKAKAKNLIAMAKGLVDDHGGEVPESMEALTKLAGVGRKTANVVLGVGLGITSGIVVDTHVTRLSRRLGLTKRNDAVGIERDLVKSVPKSDWVLISLRMIDHGRAICKAGRPQCGKCPLEPICPQIGVERKPAKATAKSAKMATKAIEASSIAVNTETSAKSSAGKTKIRKTTRPNSN
jgi:endonuclease-3